MGELCLRWGMRVEADGPLTPNGQPLQRISAPILEYWFGGSRTGTTSAFIAIASELLALDDRQDLPQLTIILLSQRTGVSYATTRQICARLMRVGYLLSNRSTAPD